MNRALAALAREAGLAVAWTDAGGRAKRVSAETVRAVLAALCLPAGTDRQIADSRARLRAQRGLPAPLTVLKPGDRFYSSKPRVRLLAEDGESLEIAMRDGRAAPPRRPGYYRIEDEDHVLAVAPERAFAVARRCWGVAVQLYALRGSKGIGDFAALAAFAGQAAAAGAAALAISPVHALFGAAPDHISPYSPSSRLFLNPLYAPTKLGGGARDGGLIDWPHAASVRLAAQHCAFDIFRRRGDKAFDAFVRQGGARLLAHARFEVLDGRFRRQGLQSWRTWPQAWRDPSRPSVRRLKASDSDVAFQLFLQWKADQGLAAAQARCGAAGMSIGLVTDMAVGMDPAGSHAWSAPEEVLRGLSIGAPPDVYNTAGQGWGLTNFSPQGLLASGYEGFLATLRAAMRHAGGIRLDHAMGLMRLWVIPDGGAPADGIYLHYPFEAMLGLLMLESHRRRALVIAEDLGTVPPGFGERIAEAGLLGMRVLWFERDRQGDFLAPQLWDTHGAALSTTHDLPTLAGWWRGRDIAWHARLGAEERAITTERKARAADRRKLWKTLRRAGSAQDAMPKETEPRRFADAAVAALAGTPCPLLVLPVEDFIGEAEQPNIPGTTDQHPNWRRRLKPLEPLAGKSARRRAALLNAGRP